MSFLETPRRVSFDQRHKLRAWAVYDLPVPSALGRVNAHRTPRTVRFSVGVRF